jgi:hypothetical protein
MKKATRRACAALGILLATLSTDAGAIAQQLGARGKILRIIVNHNANNDEIYVTTDDPAPACPEMIMRTNDPNVSPTSFKTLYTYLLVAKTTGKRLELYTDANCNLFRAEMLD